ncbi:uncharacterized protein LOC135630690 [Musa acuminata AAA Group]|uniref:uncharacterized protein LOC135630690 n=1 Tax=Musa acuminata AAA Group TaxID=214697 RepID=UPI0031D1F2D0
MDKDIYAWLSALSFAFLTYSSAVAVYRSRDDASAVTFVVVAYADLWLLFRCLRALECGGEGANNWRLRAAVWSLVTLLTSMFSYKVAAVMPWPVSVVVWGMAAAVAMGGFWAFFVHREPPSDGSGGNPE